MARELPWRSVEELVQLLTLERDAIDRQIAALNASGDLSVESGRLLALLCRYLIEGSADKAVQWSKRMGWRLDSVNHGKASTRDWKSEDIYGAIENPPEDVPTDLAELCLRVYRRAQDKSTRWN